MFSDNSLNQQQVVLVYTMTNGLGDYLVMGDVMRKAKRLLPKSISLAVHRANTHVSLWPDGSCRDIFYSIYSPFEMFNLARLLIAKRRVGYKVFGLQMSPGSLQGFALHSCLKFLGAMDYIVDFNLINADIITFVQDNYVLNRQLDQVGALFKMPIPSEFYRLDLPLRLTDQKSAIIKREGRCIVGIHPWSRRSTDSFFWPLNKWVEVIRSLLRHENIDIVIFGRDIQFESFTNSLKDTFQDAQSRFNFLPSKSVEDLVQIVSDVDLVITVNTAVVHLAYALDKKSVVLTASSLDLWNPRSDNMCLVKDDQALFKGADRSQKDKYFPQMTRIEVSQVLYAIDSLVGS